MTRAGDPGAPAILAILAILSRWRADLMAP